MQKKKSSRILSVDLIRRFSICLQEQEKSPATVQKYIQALYLLHEFLDSTEVTKNSLIDWKEQLKERYAAASVNTLLAALNGFLTFCGWTELRLKPLRIQKSVFCDAGKELNRAEYTRLVSAAKRQGNERLFLVLQTICATGIRVSELKFVTAAAVQDGKAEINNKGKRRTIFLAGRLRGLLKKYLGRQKNTAESVFVTKTGKPLDRSNIWREMKALCESAGVNPGKVFPHNLRHLFARTYYSMEKDLSRLADILGHSDVNTTRIYTLESGVVHAKQIERLGLIIT